MNFGKAIRVARATRSLSQRQLAKLADLDASYVSLVESGKREPSVKALQAVAHALDIPFYVLALLASGENDLHGISSEQASELGVSLLNLLASSE